MSAERSIDRLAYRPAEAAEALGVSVRTIHRWIASGTLQGQRQGGARLISAQEIRRLLGELIVSDFPTAERDAPETAWAEQFTNEVLG